jgi:hypothetical protein
LGEVSSSFLWLKPNQDVLALGLGDVEMGDEKLESFVSD